MIKSVLARSFNDRPTQLYMNAVRALNRLLDEEGLDSVQRAYAQATWYDIMKNYVEDNKVKLTCGAHNVTRLTTHHGLVASRSLRLKCEDHSTLWLKNGKPYRYITQPYALCLRDIRQMVNYCDEHDLEFFINSFQSWHFPGSSLMVEIKKRE